MIMPHMAKRRGIAQTIMIYGVFLNEAILACLGGSSFWAIPKIRVPDLGGGVKQILYGDAFLTAPSTSILGARNLKKLQIIAMLASKNMVI